MKDISFKQVIESAVGDISDLAKQKKVKLKVEMPRSLSRVRGSAPRLQQVMANLLNNALNYTPKGTVTVRVSQDDKEIKVLNKLLTIAERYDIDVLYDIVYRFMNMRVSKGRLGRKEIINSVEADIREKRELERREGAKNDGDIIKT